MKTVGYATTAVAIALSITLSLLAHRSIEEYALVGTGETFRAAYVCLLGAAFFLGVAVPGIVRIVWKRKKKRLTMCRNRFTLGDGGTEWRKLR